MSFNNSNPNRNNNGYYNPRYNQSKKYNNGSQGGSAISDSDYAGGSYSSGGNSGNSRRNDRDYYGGYRSNNRYDNKYNKYPAGNSIGNSSYSSKGSYYSNTSNNQSSGYRRKPNDRYDSYSTRRASPSALEGSSSLLNNSSNSFTNGRRQERNDYRYESNRDENNRDYDARDDRSNSYEGYRERRSPYLDNSGEERRKYNSSNDYDRPRPNTQFFKNESEYSSHSDNERRQLGDGIGSSNKSSSMTTPKHIPSPSQEVQKHIVDSKVPYDENLIESTQTSLPKELSEDNNSLEKKDFETEESANTAKDEIILHQNTNTIKKASEQEEPAVDAKVSPRSSETPTSPISNTHAIADSSMLSPIADSAPLDDPFFNNMETINESKEKDQVNLSSSEKDEDQDDGGISEAETVIANSPPRVIKGRRLIRKREYDEQKDKLKSKAVASSDEDEDEEEHEHEQEQITNETKKTGQKPYKIKRDSSGRSLLQRACKKGNLDEIKSLIDRGADVNESDFCGFTCLHEAALEGHDKVAELLIENGANVNAQADEAGYLETPLMDAAENKHIKTVKVLVNNGANPHIYNIDGFTALTKIENEHADDDDYEEIVAVIESASSKFTVPIKDDNEKLPSKQSDHPKTIVEDPNNNYYSDLIKRKGIFKYAAEGAKELTANYFVAGNTLASKPDILILAARNGHTELVDIILGLNPGPNDIDLENERGSTALLASVGRGHFEVVESLLSKGADPFKRRKQDHLNALQISQRSVYFDTKEVKLIQEYMDKINSAGVQTSNDIQKVTSKTSVHKNEGRHFSEEEKSHSDHEENDDYNDDHDDGNDDNGDDDDNINEQEKENEEEGDESFTSNISHNHELKRKRDLANDSATKISKKPKPEFRIKPLPSSVFKKETTPDNSENSRPKDQSFSPSSDKQRNKTNTLSPSPIPLTRAQEELKAKSAEEARIWQEKVEAKKRARRDMFLKSEKEKERKKKEEEEKKLEEEKKIALLKEKQAINLAKEVEEKSKKLDVERKALQQKLIYESYPVGLRFINFSSPVSKDTLKSLTPLYLFEINGEKFIIDLHFSLISGLTIPSINQRIKIDLNIELKAIDKSKVWSLYFPMIGIDKSKPLTNFASAIAEGHEKFQNLLLHFIKFDEVSNLVQEEFPILNQEIWGKKRFVNVSLESLNPFVSEINEPIANDNLLSDESKINIDSISTKEPAFIPPNLRHRKDTIKTIYAAHIPLW